MITSIGQIKRYRMTTDKVLLEQMCAIAYKGITGECWHKQSNGCVKIWGRDGRHDFNVRMDKCPKCGAAFQEGNRMRNPRLLNSLDAWRPLWEAMTREQKLAHNDQLRFVQALNEYYSWQATPLHHLEAVLRMLNEWKPEWEGHE